MNTGMRRCLRALALAFLVSAAAAADEATTTFLDDWLQAENPARVGCMIMVNKKTKEKIELVSLNSTADPAVRAYRNKKTGEIIYSSINAGNGDMMTLKGTDGKLVSVPTADYESFPANAVSDVTGKLKFIILDDYEESAEKVDLKDAIVFIPFTGGILSHPAVRHFSDGIAYLAKNKPACVVVVVDSPGGVIALAEEICNAIQTLHRHNIKSVSYVNGENKYAMSAGALICLSCDEIVMSPHSKMGAAIMIHGDMTNLKSGGPNDKFSDIEDKLLASFNASFRTYAAGSHFPEELALAMADKTLGAVALTVNGKTEVMSVKDAAAAKAKYTASKTPFTEKQLCPVGKPVVITAEEGVEIHAIAGMADTPQELAALVSPKSKQFAVYEPMDRFALRSKAIMDQLHQYEMNFRQVYVRAVAAGLTRDIATEMVAAMDKIIALQKRNPDFFDPEDSQNITTYRTYIIGLMSRTR
ncbi:MAG: SDH family Clp fold serine proteinase [Candidatus Brocadiia bacterium]